MTKKHNKRRLNMTTAFFKCLEDYKDTGNQPSSVMTKDKVSKYLHTSKENLVKPK